MPTTHEGAIVFDLDPAYEILPTLKQDDPQRLRLATMSPLLFTMHLDPEVKPYLHMRYLDAHLVALTNLRLYHSGPGPEPTVWIRDSEGRGEFYQIGTGYAAAVSNRAYDADERLFLRPGADPKNRTEDDEVVTRLAIAMPPRHGKSIVVTGKMPTWFLLRYPTNAVIMATYNQDYADEWGSSLQDMHDEKQDLIPLATDGKPLAPISATNKEMSYRPGKDSGTIKFRGAGKSITGTGAGLLIIDDPIKGHTEAMSPARRKDKVNWYTSTWTNRRTRKRGAPPPLEVMMFTRWHELDLAGTYVYASDGETPKPDWCAIRLPAFAEQGDPLGRPVGATLCPQLADRAYLLKEREASPLWFQCLFQGSPNHEEGGLIPKTYENPDGSKSYYHYSLSRDSTELVTPNGRVPRKELTLFATMDTATSLKTRADYTVVSLWGYHQATHRLFLLRYKRDRVSSETHADFLQDFLPKDGSLSFVGIEDKTFGTSLINALRQDSPGLPVTPMPANSDKLTRAIGYVEAIKQGKVLFPDPDIVFDGVIWESEHARFPDGAHDDMVDTGSMAWTSIENRAYTVKDPDPPPEPTLAERGWASIRQSSEPDNRHPYAQLLDRINHT